MGKYNFLNPTAKYKQFKLLSTIEKGESLTQREIASRMGIAVSMVNTYLNTCLKEELVDRKENSKKDVKYNITEKGIAKKKNLNIEFLKSALNIYNLAKQNIYPFLVNLVNRNIKDVVFYGAGEVAEMLLHVINMEPTLNLNVIALIDDDINKQNTNLINTKILSSDVLSSLKYDALIISSYKNDSIIKNRIKELSINSDNVISLKDEG